ncbi:MAG: hypothetical protein IKD21_04755 [Clostridia bacterium]|nr:hypothetical protein [Clostridia bacterium]
MRKEIGSEFWSVPVAGDNGLFADAVWFVSGRSALYAIIRENTFKTVVCRTGVAIV